jgi:hypothetical protein
LVEQAVLIVLRRLILASALVRSDWPADAKRQVREVRMLDPGLTLGRFAQASPIATKQLSRALSKICGLRDSH